jgi:hypothetical protein
MEKGEVVLKNKSILDELLEKRPRKIELVIFEGQTVLRYGKKRIENVLSRDDIFKLRSDLLSSGYSVIDEFESNGVYSVYENGKDYVLEDPERFHYAVKLVRVR